MKKLILAGTFAATLAVPIPAAAQSAQERLEARYDRALAAGYKALFLCSALATSSGARTPESVHEWELSGIQRPLDAIIRDLPYEIVRRSRRSISHVTVEWAPDMPPRIAIAADNGGGCSILPIGTPGDPRDPDREIIPSIVGEAMFRQRENADWATGLAAFDGTTYGEGSRTTAVLVTVNGELFHESYAEGFGPTTTQRTWSVAKSIAATFVGAAVHKGEIDVTRSAGLGLSNEDPRRAIIIDHALRMASGRYSDTPGNRTDPLYWGGTTVTERAQNWPLIHTPGSVYRYANNDTLAAIQAVQPAFGDDPAWRFLGRFGMYRSSYETDWQGNYVMSSQVWANARDLAKLGQLYLNDGVWRGNRILPKGWRDYVSTPSGPQPQGTRWGYGAGWWTFRRPEGNAFEGIPDDAFAARGNRGQYVVVVPSRNVVIVRRGEDKVGTRFDIAAFARDILAALE